MAALPIVGEVIVSSNQILAVYKYWIYFLCTSPGTDRWGRGVLFDALPKEGGTRGRFFLSHAPVS